MNSFLEFRDLWLADGLPPVRAGELLRTAADLRRSQADPATRQLLRGKNIALLCRPGDEGAREDANLFCLAAAGLGARVSQVRPDESALAPGRPADDLRSLARVLGRLYDAIECQGLADEVVAQLAGHAGVPVFNGIGRRTHPLAAWAGKLDGGQHAGERGGADAQADRQALIQSLLVGTLR